ncbi:MAG: hypothetical protein ABSB50_14750 [Terracidiphilus sp.]|jgi:hypothetical protein
MGANRLFSVSVLMLAATVAPLAAQSHPKSPTPSTTSGTPAAHAAAAPGHTFKCTAGTANTPCTAADVQNLNAMVVSGRRMYKPLATIASISLAGADGSLTCTQTSGAACTDDQMNSLDTYAAQQKKGGGKGCCTVMKSTDVASP